MIDWFLILISVLLLHAESALHHDASIMQDKFSVNFQYKHISTVLILYVTINVENIPQLLVDVICSSYLIC